MKHLMNLVFVILALIQVSANSTRTVTRQLHSLQLIASDPTDPLPRLLRKKA